MNEESKLIELFKKYSGIAARIRRSFAYHYDQIQREIKAEVATINKDDAATIIDYNVDEVDMVLYGATLISLNRKNTNHLSWKNSNTTRIISTRKNMPRKSNITLTFSKNQKLFTLSLKILSTFSNPLSNEN